MWLLWSAAVSWLWGLVWACVGRRRLVVMSSDCGSQYSCLLFPAVPPIQPMTLGKSLSLWALLSVITSLHPKLFPVICLWSTLTSQIQSTAKKKKKRKKRKKYCCRYSAFKIPNKMCCRFLSWKWKCCNNWWLILLLLYGILAMLKPPPFGPFFFKNK